MCPSVVPGALAAGLPLPPCSYHKHCQLRRRKTLQCIRCKHQTSLLAGTVFENTKLGLSLWYLAMYLLTQSKSDSDVAYRRAG